MLVGYGPVVCSICARVADNGHDVILEGHGMIVDARWNFWGSAAGPDPATDFVLVPLRAKRVGEIRYLPFLTVAP
jgi:hypothetical protein